MFVLCFQRTGIILTVAEICRELGISQQTFYRWRRKLAGMGVAELNRLKELERENKRLGTTRP